MKVEYMDEQNSIHCYHNNLAVLNFMGTKTHQIFKFYIFLSWSNVNVGNPKVDFHFKCTSRETH